MQQGRKATDRPNLKLSGNTQDIRRRRPARLSGDGVAKKKGRNKRAKLARPFHFLAGGEAGLAGVVVAAAGAAGADEDVAAGVAAEGVSFFTDFL